MSSKRLNLALLAIVVALAWAGCEETVQPVAKAPAVSQAAKPKPSSERPYVTLKRSEESIRCGLLLSQTVQDDLAMSAEQREKMKGIMATGKQITLELGGELREANPSGKRYSKEEAEVRDQLFSALFDELKSKTKELQTKKLAILTPAQTERLKQIQLQAAIGTTLQTPEIAKALSITKEQNARINAIRDREREELEELVKMHPAPGGLTATERGNKLIELSKKSKEIGAENQRAILELLTPDQRVKYTKIVGKLIEPKWSYDSVSPEEIGAAWPN